MKHRSIRIATWKAWIRAAVFGLFVVCARSAWAEPVRLLVAVGSKLGLEAEVPLKFAETDARRVRDVVVAQGGVSAKDAVILSEPTRAQLMTAIDRVRDQARGHKSEEVTLLFYFSGHGDRDAIHLGTERVLLSDLTAKLAEVPAGLRIVVTDACRSTREKGFAIDEPFAISVKASQARGQVWLHAASDGETAQESDDLQGAIFTNAWLNGLRGAADVNGDARVTLEESFSFAHTQTLLRSAKSSGVLQKPEAVMDLRESAPFVLTETPQRMAKLLLPAGKDSFFLVYSSGAKSVISELWSLPERRMLLNLPAGKYVVHRRIGARTGAATIALSEGESRDLQDREFVAGSSEVLAKKGLGDPDRAATEPSNASKNEIWAGYDLAYNVRTSTAQGAHATYARTWNQVALTIGGGFEGGARSLPDIDEKLTTAYLRAGIEARVPVGAVMLRAGGGGRGGVVFQTLTPNPEGRMLGGEVTKQGFVFGPEIFLAARFVLDPKETFFLEVGAVSSLLFLREEQTLRGIFTAGGNANLGARF